MIRGLVLAALAAAALAGCGVKGDIDAPTPQAERAQAEVEREVGF